MRFTGKTILVTGAGSGIGAATARRFAAEGGNVALAGRRREALTSTAEGLDADKVLAHPASVDTIPTSANQEDHVSMATHGAYRLLRMARNAANIVAIELLAACQGCDFHAPLRSSEALERVRALLRERVPHLEADRLFAPDIDAAVELVMSEAIAKTAGLFLPAPTNRV